MSLFVASLNSGSNGNCYYIGNGEEAILVDGGISCRETEKRMKRLELSMRKVKAIFVTHEHGDHIHGVPVLARRHDLPVYITRHTMQRGGLSVKESLVRGFCAYEPVSIGGLTITGFPKFHDACDPHSFVVEGHGITVGVFTDIGYACEHVTRQFQRCHAAFLEANYDEDMLERGSYPYPLKARIRGDRGHLSNRQAVELFVNHRPSFMSHLFLSHLSRDNNKPALVQQLFDGVAAGTTIVVASRDQESEVYHIRDTFRRADLAVPRLPVVRRAQQLRLFS
jgi:phosphoribosyl 1,2-cyclic phosphodiesterase